MTEAVHHLLRQWGDYVRQHLDFADEFGENILHRHAQWGFTDSTTGQMKHDDNGEPIGRDSVLCPDMPARFRRVEVALNCIDKLQANCLRLHYAAPIRDDGQLYTVAQMARVLGINKGKFRAEVRKGRRSLSGIRRQVLDSIVEKKT